MPFPPVQSKSVLITGCSSGIGLACAEVLKEAGWRVIPTARKPADLERLKEQGFDPVGLDLADSDSVQAAAKQALEMTGGTLGCLVNNAGFGQPGAMEDLTRETLRYQFEVNLFGLQELTNAVLPSMREQGWGRIVQVGSIVGKICLPFFGAYSATKFAVEAVTDALRVELHDTGISVSLIEPGPIASRFGDNAAERVGRVLDSGPSRYGELYEKAVQSRDKKDPQQERFRLPPEAVAEVVKHALESPRPKTRYPVTLPAKLGVWLKKFTPDRTLDRILLNRWKKKTNSSFRT